jgi:predicted dinucleotide-binding enzyme
MVGTAASAVREVGRWSEVLCIGVPWSAIPSVVSAAADSLDGKLVIDATNALDASAHHPPEFTMSGAEELQRLAPKARVVKAFNVIMAQQLEKGSPGGQVLTTLIAGDDAEAKRAALELAREIGFVAMDAGLLENARILEAMPVLNTQLGYFLGVGTPPGPGTAHG